MNVLITGGSGYFGRLLTSHLTHLGHQCTVIDLVNHLDETSDVRCVQGDVANYEALEPIARSGRFDVIFHLASMIDFAVKSQDALYQNNVESTRNVVRVAREFEIPKVVFTSSNSVYLGNRSAEVLREGDIPIATDAYGKSKLASEALLREAEAHFATVSIRCPNIIDAGRIGMLSILFEFILEGRKCWVIGDGSIRHQCIYAGDLIDACMKSVDYPGSATFNIGSDDVPTFSEMYRYIIDRAGTGARVAHVPGSVAIPLLRAAHRLGLSPLGEYQFRMLTSNFIFDTSLIKRALSWEPTLNNSEMLTKAYEYYVENREQILNDQARSANSGAVAMGVVNLLRRLS